MVIFNILPILSKTNHLKPLPTSSKYFTEFSKMYKIELPKHFPDINQLLSINTQPSVISFHLLSNPRAVSREGKMLTGAQLIVKLKLLSIIKYCTDTKEQNVHYIYDENVLSFISIAVPKLIFYTSIDELVQNNKISINPYLEETFVKKFNCRTILYDVSLFVDAEFKDINRNTK